MEINVDERIVVIYYDENNGTTHKFCLISVYIFIKQTIINTNTNHGKVSQKVRIVSTSKIVAA